MGKQQCCVVINDGDHPAWTFWVCGSDLILECGESGVAQDIGLGTPPIGISIWEGTVQAKYLRLPARYTGSYRALTDAEWARLRQGKAPWDG